MSSRSSSLAAEPAGEPAREAARSPRGDLAWYAGPVLLGAVLLVVTAVRQPFSYDELSQITPYGSNSVVDIVSGTRQPPVDALLGGLFRHLFGQGQLQQRLVPVLSGIGILVVASLLFRRLGLGRAGAWGVLVLATAPLAVRYGAYTRPYAIPMLEMLFFTYAVNRWLDGRDRRWLRVVAVTAVLLPLTRVPEPCAFLGVSSVMLWWASRRGRLAWAGVRPVIAWALGALFVVGVPLFLLLGSQTQGQFFDPSPGGILSRAGAGFHEIATSVVPLLGSSFPWWPLSLAVVVVTLVVGPSRRWLLGWPFFLPLLAGPVAFLLAYHLLNPFSFFALPYRSRAAYFFIAPYLLLTVAAASLVGRREIGRWWRAAVAVLLAASLITQLPATFRTVSTDAAPDFGAVSKVLTTEVPDDAIVLYDRPTPAGQSRQPFQGSPRYMGSTPYVTSLADLGKDPSGLPRTGPVYVLINGQCARHGRCHLSREPWVRHVDGWRVARTQERFSLYAPTDGQAGRTGVVEAMLAFAKTLGPELGYAETLNAAVLIKDQGDPQRAAAIVRQLRSEVSPLDNRRIDDFIRLKHFPVTG